LWAETPCTLKDFTGKINQTDLYHRQQQIDEIEVSGKTKAMSFHPNVMGV
jgi:hypothetical protein